MKDPAVGALSWIFVGSGMSCLLVLLFSAFSSSNDIVLMRGLLSYYEWMYMPAAIGAVIGFGVWLLIERADALAPDRIRRS